MKATVRVARAWRAILAAGAMILAACPKLSQQQQLQLHEWQLCDDCSAATRLGVAALPEPLVVQALRHDLLQGPDQGRTDIMRRQLSVEYTESPTHVVPESVFVNRYLASYRAIVRTRSAISLGDIATPNAIAALQAALDQHRSGRDTLPPSAVLAVERALAAPAPSFDGSLSDSLLGFLDTVRVFPRAGTRWTAPSVELRGGPFPDVLLGRATRDSLRLVAAAEPGDYVLVVTDSQSSRSLVSQSARLRITSLRYTSRDTLTALNLGARPWPQRHFFAMGRPATGDTSEVFMIRPAVNLRGVLTADWRGPGSITLAGEGCTSPVSVPPAPPPPGPHSVSIGFGVAQGATCRVRAAYSGPTWASVVARVVVTVQ